MDDKHAIETLIQDYFDALYDGDVKKFGEVFHPSCRLFTAGTDGVMTFDYEPYLARVAGRPSSASRGDAREDEIVSLSVSAPTIAHATVKDCYLPAHFTNELVFLKTEGRWYIVAKIWHMEG